MFSGAYIFLLASFVNLLSIKDSIGIDLIDLSVYQDGDCEPETQLQKETGRCPTRLVSPSSRHCTPWAFEVEEHHTYPWKPPFQRHEFSLSSCRSNDDDESCSMEMPHLSAIEEEQCNVLFRMPATMAKRDRPVLCTRLEADGTDGPRPVSAVTMAAASTTRLASALAVDIFERKDTFSEAKTTAKERQRQQDPQTEPAAADAGSAHDDAGCSHGADCTDACHVPPAGNAVSNARDNASIAPTRCSMATACQSQFGENASSSSCCTTSDGYAFYPHDASTANAKNAGDIDDIKFRHRCRGQRADDHDEGKTIRATRGYAKEGPKGLDQIWTAIIHGFACSRHCSGHCTTELRRGCHSPESTPQHVEEVPIGRCPVVADVCTAIHGAGEEAARASEHFQGRIALRQEGPREFQAGKAWHWWRAEHHLGRGDGGSRFYECGPSCHQDHGNDGGSGQFFAVPTSRSRSYGGGRSSRCQEAKNHAKSRRRCNGRSKAWVAFWQGWLSMTIQYANLKPWFSPDSTIPGEIAVMKWSHSIIEERNFLNEWAAIEEARCLAFDIGTYNGIVIEEFNSRKRLKSPTSSVSPARGLGFAPDVDVLIGLEDELVMYKTVVPEISLCKGLMPWRTGLQRGGSFSHQPPDDVDFEWTRQNPLPMKCPASSTSDRTGHIDQDRPSGDLSLPHASGTQRPTETPSWQQELLTLLEQEGQIDLGEDDFVVYASSFFIDHLRLQFHNEPRVLRFDADYQDWDSTTRFIWEDLADPNLPLEIVIVKPDPPRFPFPGTSATVIVHQNLRPERAACLITTVRIQDPETIFQHTAHSVERRLMPARVLQLAGVEQLCQQREAQGFGPCTLHIGHQVLPMDQDIDIHHGLGLHIRIPSTLSQEEAEQNLVRRLQQQRRNREGDHWDPALGDDEPEAGHPPRSRPRHAAPDNEPPEDAISFMGRRPVMQNALRIEASSSTSSSSSTISSVSSSAVSSTDWRSTVIHTLDGRSISARLPWNDYDQIVVQAAIALSLEKDSSPACTSSASTPNWLCPGRLALPDPTKIAWVPSLSNRKTHTCWPWNPCRQWCSTYTFQSEGKMATLCNHKTDTLASIAPGDFMCTATGMPPVAQ